jgi:hypothetical protein
VSGVNLYKASRIPVALTDAAVYARSQRVTQQKVPHPAAHKRRMYAHNVLFASVQWAVPHWIVRHLYGSAVYVSTWIEVPKFRMVRVVPESGMNLDVVVLQGIGRRQCCRLMQKQSMSYHCSASISWRVGLPPYPQCCGLDPG